MMASRPLPTTDKPISQHGAASPEQDGALPVSRWSSRLQFRLWHLFALMTYVAVTTAIALLYVVAHQGMSWWWLLPVAVTALLALSLNNASRARQR